MLSGSEASNVAMLRSGGPRCFAAAQHDLSRTVFHDMLRRQPVQVARESRDQLDVGGAGELHEQAFKANGEAAVRRHTVLERLKVCLERLSGQICLLQSRQVVLVAVQALTARDQLGAAKEQVERVGIFRATRLR